MTYYREKVKSEKSIITYKYWFAALIVDYLKCAKCRLVVGVGVGVGDVVVHRK